MSPAELDAIEAAPGALDALRLIHEVKRLGAEAARLRSALRAIYSVGTPDGDEAALEMAGIASKALKAKVRA